MRRNGLKRKILASALLTLSASVSAFGLPPVTVEQPIPSFGLFFQDAGVPDNATGAVVTKPPTHFDLAGMTPIDGEWTLAPHASFWSVGIDRLEVSWAGPTAGSSTVLLVAGRPGVDYATGFEAGDPMVDRSNLSSAVTIGPEGAILGARGAYVSVEDGNGYAGVLAPCCDTEHGNASSSQVHVGVEPPPGTQGSINWPIGHEALTVLAAYDANDGLLAELQLAAFQGNPEMRIVAHGSGGLVEGTWFPIDYDKIMKVRFDGYFGTNLSTLALVVDDRVRDLLDGFSTTDHPASYRLGAPAGASSVPFGVRLDALELGQAGPTADWQLALADDFLPSPGPGPGQETFPQWLEVVEGAGALTVTASQELAITITNPRGWGAYLRDSTPVQADGYSVRFTVDTTLLTMAAGDEMSLLVAYPDDPVGNDHLQVRIRPDGNDFEVRADAEDNLGVLHDVSWQDISRGEHLIEVQWRAAATGQAADGYVRLFIDGQYAGEATGIANDQRRIEAIRFGALGIEDGTSGTITFDEFASFTASPPAPLP